MQEEWDNSDPVVEPWEDSDPIDEVHPPKSTSEKVAREIYGWDMVRETTYLAGSAIANETSRGLAGVAGFVAGLTPGGESPMTKAGRYHGAVPDFTYQPQTEGGQKGLEHLQTFAHLSKVPGATIAGVGGGLGADNYREGFRDEFDNFMDTQNPVMEGVFRETQSPTLTAIAAILPEVALMYSPTGKMKTKPKPDMDVPTGRQGMDVPDGYGGTAMPDMGPPPSAADFDAVRRALAAGDKEALLKLVEANPTLVAAFDQLGIEFTPAMVSDNAALRQLEAGMASAADSGLPNAYELTQRQLDDRARQLIDDAGGNADSPASVAQDIDARYNEIRQGYIDEERVIWESLEKQIAPGEAVDAQQIAGRLYDDVRNLGRNGNIDDGLRGLSRHERRLFEITHEHRPIPGAEGKMRWEYSEPTYAMVDRLRKDIGDGLNGKGPFANEATGQLKKMYGELAELQQRVAKGRGYDADWDRMNELTVMRKDLEDAIVRVQGRNLNQSVVTRITSATNKLLKGDIKAWDQLMKDLPPDQRAAAAATAMGDIMFTSGQKTKTSGRFTSNFEKIKRDAQLRDRLLDPLPLDARAQFMRLGEAVTGFQRAIEKLNRSNTANAQNVLQRIQDGSMFQRVVRGVGDKTLGKAPVVREYWKDFSKPGGTRRVTAAADLIEDPALHRAIIEYAAGRLDEANAILRQSQGFVKWVMAQDVSPARKRAIVAGGIAGLIDGYETEEDNDG